MATHDEVRAQLVGLQTGAHQLATQADATLAAFDTLEESPPPVDPPPVDPPPATNAPPDPSGGDDTAALQAYLNAHLGKLIAFDPTKTYRCDRQLVVTDQVIEDASIVAGPEGAGIGGAHPYRNIYVWHCPTGSSATFRRCKVKGRNSGGGMTDPAYDAEREAQHAWNVEGCASFTMVNCSATEIWGDGAFFGPGNGPCKKVNVDGLDVTKTGRQGMALTGIDGGVFQHVTTHEMRRSCVDIEPLLPTFGEVRNVTFQDCNFGPGRLLVMAGKGMGGNVTNVTWLRCTNTAPTGTPILQLGASDAAVGGPTRGPFLMQDCTWVVGGSPAGGFELTNVAGFTFRNVKATFPASRNMSAVTLTRSTNVVLENCDFTGAKTRVLADASSTFTDDAGSVTPPPAGASVQLAGPASIQLPGQPSYVATLVNLAAGVTVSQVQFLDGTTLVGTDTASPYTAQPALPAGVHTVTAKAVLSDGTTVTSAAVTTTVTAATTPPPTTSWEDGKPNGAALGTKMTVSGVTATYGGQRWLFLNESTAAGTPYVKTGYTIFRADLKGDNVNLPASQQAFVAAVEQAIAAWKLNSLGYYVGHSTNSTMPSKSIRGEGDVAAAAKVVSHLRGLGLSGSAWRTTTTTVYPAGGVPGGPAVWPAQLKRFWILNGCTYHNFNQHDVVNGEVQMILPEIWHWVATMRKLISTTYATIAAMPQMVPEPTAPANKVVSETLTQSWRLDVKGNDMHVRMDVAAVPDGHTMTPTTMNAPASFWEVMEDDAGGTTPPVGGAQVTLTAPTGSFPAGPVNFSANVVEAQGQATKTVEYLSDGVAAAPTDTPPPPYIKPGSLTAGTHVLTVRHTSMGNVVTMSPPVTVTATGVVPPDPGPGPPPGPFTALKVNGRQLQLADGTRWVGRGTNQYMDSYVSAGDTQMPAVSGWVISNVNKITQEWASLGVNWLRLPINNSSAASYITRVKVLTDACASAGIRVMLCPFGGVTWAPSAACGQLVAATWNAIGRPTHVLCETVNEPNQISNAAWLAGNQAEIAAIRGAGYTQPIFVGCQNWCWTLPVAEARQLRSQDAQLVFMHHRYAFDGSTIRGGGDAAAFVAEWSQASDLCVAVGEYGWYNNGGNAASIDAWCRPMSDAMVKGVQDGWLAAQLSWMYLWDQNSHIIATAPPPGEPSSGNRDWYAISRGAPWTLNPWGQNASSVWPRLKALVP